MNTSREEYYALVKDAVIKYTVKHKDEFLKARTAKGYLCGLIKLVKELDNDYRYVRSSKGVVAKSDGARWHDPYDYDDLSPACKDILVSGLRHRIARANKKCKEAKQTYDKLSSQAHEGLYHHLISELKLVPHAHPPRAMREACKLTIKKVLNGEIFDKNARTGLISF